MKKFEIVLMAVLAFLLSFIISLRVQAYKDTKTETIEELEELEEVQTVTPILHESCTNLAPTIDLTVSLTVGESATVEEKEQFVIYEMYYDDADVTAMAKMLWGEARGCTEEDKRNCCITACNRADDSRFPNTVHECITQQNQYHGYRESNPIDEELYALAESVLIDWSLKKQGIDVDWNDYNSFWGDGTCNHFSKK